MAVKNPSQRIKGQETAVLITQDGSLQDTLVDIQSFTLEAQFEIISKGYLGEKTNRKDYIFNGVKFTMKLHLHKQDWFVFQKSMKDKAQRNTPDTQFNITSVLSFPNGETPTILVPDVSFGTNPMGVTSRGDYVDIGLEGEADDFTATTS